MLILHDIMDAICFSKTGSVYGLQNNQIIQIPLVFSGDYIPLPMHPDQETMAKEFLASHSIEVDEPETAKRSYYLTMIENHSLKTAWHEWEQSIYKDMAIRWCEDHNIPYTDKPRRYLWCTRNDIYYLEDEVLQKRTYTRLPNSILEEEKNALQAELEAVGYRTQYSFVANLLDSLIGQTWHDLISEATRRGVKNARKRKPRVNEEQKWKDLYKRFSGQIIALDKKSFRKSKSGFAIRILLKRSSVEEIKKFVNQNRDDILTWCREELQENKSIMNRVGDLAKYKPVKIILLQSCELEVVFEKRTASS